ncbi:hypothetical protein [Nocardia sp. R6R-6]|uniref:hypothetical protein n=1 Tax=Nocardia sp. R6R-6 TaxID=3459303 RepID=UPI00403DDCF8
MIELIGPRITALATEFAALPGAAESARFRPWLDARSVDGVFMAWYFKHSHGKLRILTGV